MQDVKRKLYEYCVAYLSQRISNSREAIHSAQESANEEDKNSSGDKYETGRAMMQIDIEQNSTQLAEALKLKSQLEKISVEQRPSRVQAGSLVITSSAKYFVAISVGAVKLDGEQYYVIAPDSPIGQKMIGLVVNESFTFANRTQKISEIF